MPSLKTKTMALKIHRIDSPHYDNRHSKIDLLVMHATATSTLDETFGYLIYSKAPNRVSAHYVVDRDGKIYQLVNEDKRAWHAGISSWGDIVSGDARCDVNAHSIGIEFQCPIVDGQLGDFTSFQIEAGILLCRQIVKRYHIVPENLVRHSDIAPERKSDPGAFFPWKTFKKDVYAGV